MRSGPQFCASGALDRSAIERRLCVPSLADLCVLQSVDSTNAEAKRRIDQHAALPFIIAADTQSAGRGRLGKAFYSPPGCGAYFSIACAWEEKAMDALRLTTLASVAAAQAIEALTGLSPAIKWVNDLYLNNKKICGILCEGVIDPGTSALTAAVVGIGVNMRPAALPEDIAGIAGALDTDVPREALIAAIANRFFALLNVPPANYMDDYRARSLVIGRAITYVGRGETAPAHGQALTVLDDGALLVRHDDGTVATLRTGEITLRLQ